MSTPQRRPTSPCDRRASEASSQLPPGGVSALTAATSTRESGRAAEVEQRAAEREAEGSAASAEGNDVPSSDVEPPSLAGLAPDVDMEGGDVGGDESAMDVDHDSTAVENAVQGDGSRVDESQSSVSGSEAVDTAVNVDGAPRRGLDGQRRSAAVAADSRIAVASAEDLRRVSLPRRRPVVTEEDRESADPAYVIAGVSQIVNRKEVDGVVYYLVKWEEVGEGEDILEWVPHEDCRGAPVWVKLVDDWIAAKERLVAEGKPVPKFHTFIASHRSFLTLGSSSDFTCVYTAFRAAIALLKSSYQLTDAEIRVFEEQSRVRPAQSQGLSKMDVVKLFHHTLKRGWKVHVSKNLYLGLYTGFCGIAYAINKPGVYIVATCDEKREGHCFVVEATEHLEMFFHEGTARRPLGDLDGAYMILWMRRVTPAAKAFLTEDNAGCSQTAKLRPMKAFGVKKWRRTKTRRSGSKKKKQPLVQVREGVVELSSDDDGESEFCEKA